jgi:hypothetical protein
LLAIVAMLAVPGTALAAKTKVKVEPGQTTGVLDVQASNGWRVQISGGIFGATARDHPVGVFAEGPHHQEVDYQQFPGRFGKDGRIVAKLPGVGRIDLRYEPTSRHTTHVSHQKNCSGPDTTIDSSGVFRGTIALHGEGGFTTVMAHSAKGQLFTFPEQTCRVRVRSKERIKREIEASAGKADEEEPLYEVLYAFRKLGPGSLTFTASSFRTELRGFPPRTVEITAEYFRHHDGMWVTAKTSVEGKPEDFTVTGATGTPSEAMVEPPAPFEGSAEFTLESPTVANWTGDLRVPIPTLGTVALTGPKFEPTLCGGACTDTAPGSHVTVSLPGSFTGNFFGG